MPFELTEVHKAFAAREAAERTAAAPELDADARLAATSAACVFPSEPKPAAKPHPATER